jgi:hypothetical protein
MLPPCHIFAIADLLGEFKHLPPLRIVKDKRE